LATSARLEAGFEHSSVARVTFVYFDAGGGHRSVMNALCAVIRDQRRPWEIQCLNLQELLDPVDPIRKIAGIRAQDVYNFLLKNGWTLGAAQLLPILHALIRFHHSRVVHLLERSWRECRPDAIVSLIPHFNRQLAESVRKVLPGRPFVTVLTDLADYPPHVWIEQESEYLICGTACASRQAVAMGHPEDHVFSTSGMIVNPSFYTNEARDRRGDRLRLGLEADRMTGLVLFGGHGSRVMLKIARKLDSMENLQLIFIAGRNVALAQELRSNRFHNPVHVEGFTTRLPYYMHLSDFLIGKPGPGSISEALVMGLPVIVECNAWTLPQERFNTEWIEEKGVGLVIGSFRHIDEAVKQLLDPTVLAHFRANISALRNRAVFEVPEIFETILQRTRREAAVKGM
jgi:1,2-diacylglycerol 3-beta-galactosyltransferase